MDQARSDRLRWTQLEAAGLGPASQLQTANQIYTDAVILRDRCVRAILDLSDGKGHPRSEIGAGFIAQTVQALGRQIQGVEAESMYLLLRFDPAGPQSDSVALHHPFDAARAHALGQEAMAESELVYPKVCPSHGDTSSADNRRDAFRHIYWSFNMAREMGPERAKEFGDAHERDRPNPIGERVMDLYNNDHGRELALDPSNRERDPAEVVKQAVEEERVQTHPF